MKKRKEAPAKQEKGVKKLKKGKHTKKGILGYPIQSKNKILFIVNNVIQLFSYHVTRDIAFLVQILFLRKKNH